MYVNIWDEDGVSKMIQMMKTELETTMQLLGKNHASRINSSCVSCRLLHSHCLTPIICLG
jgi:hypothetical protein